MGSSFMDRNLNQEFQSTASTFSVNFRWMFVNSWLNGIIFLLLLGFSLESLSGENILLCLGHSNRNGSWLLQVGFSSQFSFNISDLIWLCLIVCLSLSAYLSTICIYSSNFITLQLINTQKPKWWLWEIVLRTILKNAEWKSRRYGIVISLLFVPSYHNS